MRFLLNKLKVNSYRDIYYYDDKNLIISFVSITEDKSQKNPKYRLQVNKDKLDALKNLSLSMNKQIIILGELILNGESIYVYMDNSIYFNRNHKGSTSTWINDKSAIIDAYNNKTIEIGSEYSGSVSSLVFTTEKADAAINRIISSYPHLQRFISQNIPSIDNFIKLLNNKIKDNQYSEVIGYIGEYLFYKIHNELEIDGKKIKNIKWNYEEGNIYENHDFQVLLEDERGIFIEVKTTSFLNEDHIISKNEIEFMKSNKNNYVLSSISLSKEFISYIINSNKFDLNIIDDFIKNKKYTIYNNFGLKEINDKFYFDAKQYFIRDKNEKI